MGGIFSSPDTSTPPAQVQAAVAPAGRNIIEKTTTRNADSVNQRRRAAATGSGRNTILTSAIDKISGESKTLLGS